MEAVLIGGLVVDFMNGSFDDPGVVTQCLEEDQIVSEGELVLADV